jgi:hypothetical protein
MSARPVCRDTDLSDTRPLAGRFKVEAAQAQNAHSSTDIHHRFRTLRQRQAQSCLSRYRRDRKSKTRWSRSPLANSLTIPSRKERAISADHGVLRAEWRATPKSRLCWPRGARPATTLSRRVTVRLRPVMIYWRARPINGHAKCAVGRREGRYAQASPSGLVGRLRQLRARSDEIKSSHLVIDGSLSPLAGRGSG